MTEHNTVLCFVHNSLPLLWKEPINIEFVQTLYYNGLNIFFNTNKTEIYSQSGFELLVLNHSASFTHIFYFVLDIYRGIVEWRGFTWTGRVSYSAFLLHTIFQRTYIGHKTTTLVMSDYNVVGVLRSFHYILL